MENGRQDPRNGGYFLEQLRREGRAERDERARLYISPRRILWESEGENCCVVGSAALLMDKPGQVSLHSDACCTLKNSGESASILLDFGQELHGGIELSVQKVTGAQRAKLRIRFGESATEAMSELGGATNATNDHARRDLEIYVHALSMDAVGETGFRFVRIDLLSENVAVSLKAAKAVLVYLDVPYLGSFHCSDALLERIWDVAAYTVHLNMQQYIWDGIKRDRLVWMGDLHPEIASIQTVFGDQPIIRRSLDFIAADTPPGKWMNDIPSYSMWWVITQYDYFMHFGDRGYLRRQLPCLAQICRMLSAHIGKDGQDTTPEMRFVDWPTRGDKAAVDMGLQALHVLATRCAMEIFALFGDAKARDMCARDLEKLQAWKMGLCAAKQANALAVWAGLLDAGEANEKSLRVGGAEGLSTFMAYYILRARAEAGDVAGSLDTIREYWGGMLKLGATTFWEDFDVRWLKNAAPIDRLPFPGEVDVHATYGSHCYKGFRHSLCHGWASGVTSWLARCVLGVEILEPGCRRIRLRPELCGLQWVRGAYPTPMGLLLVEHRRRENGETETVFQAPPGVKVQR